MNVSPAPMVASSPRLTPEEYLVLRERLVALGYGDEIEWQGKAAPPDNPEDFALEVIYVICASGMKQQTARLIYNRIVDAMSKGKGPATVFRHALKCRAIEAIWSDRHEVFAHYQAARTADEQLAVLRSLDHIGSITVWHLAKNFGMDVAKPDRHLERLAVAEGSTPQELCERLAKATGDRVAVVDLVLWRACNLGLLRPPKGGTDGNVG
jgi:hypothetical protein